MGTSTKSSNHRIQGGGYAPSTTSQQRASRFLQEVAPHWKIVQEGWGGGGETKREGEEGRLGHCVHKTSKQEALHCVPGITTHCVSGLSLRSSANHGRWRGSRARRRGSVCLARALDFILRPWDPPEGFVGTVVNG